MSEQKQPRCETCPFWDDLRDGTPGGICRFLIPTQPTEVCAHKNFGVWQQPVTRPDDWCFEHPDAPRIVTVREATVLNKHTGIPIAWREWTEIETKEDRP